MFFLKNTVNTQIFRQFAFLCLLVAVVVPTAGVHAVSNQNEVKGEASYYSQQLVGKRTNSGEPYDDKAFTAAHAHYPFGTYLLVTLIKNQQSVVVRVNDRFRPRKGHLLDLSMAAAKKIDLVRLGRAQVTLRVLDEEEALLLMKGMGQEVDSMRVDSVSLPLPVPELNRLPIPVGLLPEPTVIPTHDFDR